MQAVDFSNWAGGIEFCVVKPQLVDDTGICTLYAVTRVIILPYDLSVTNTLAAIRFFRSAAFSAPAIANIGTFRLARR